MIGFLNAAGRMWYEPFGLMVIQNTVFLGVVFAVLWWLRGASARVRYAVAMVGLVKLITPPFLPAAGSGSEGYIDLSAISAVPYRPMTLPGVEAAPVESITLAGLLFAVWCVAVLGVIVYTVVSTVRLHRALRHADDAWDGDSARLTWETGVRVRVSDHVPVPMTVGVLPATIFVPPHWSGWSSRGRRAVIRHEMAHIRRRDGVVRALETVVRALYWFHPLVALLMQRIDVYREQACDERAAAPDPEGRLAYSQQLVEIAEHLFERPGVRGSASALLRRRNELLGRVHYLTREGSIMKLNKARAAVLAIGLAAAIVSLSWYHGTAQPPPPKKAKKYATVELSVADGGVAAVNGEKVKVKQIGDEIRKQIGDQNAVIHIQCKSNVPMKDLFLVHAVLRDAGMYKVKYAGLGGDEVPLVLPSKAMEEKSKQLAPEDVVELKVYGGGKCVLGDQKVKMSALPKHVMKRLQDNEYLVVSLTMAADATFGDYVETLKYLEQANAERILINEPATL